MGVKVYKNRETLKFPPYTNQGGKIAHTINNTTANYVSDTNFRDLINHTNVVSGMKLSTLGNNIVVSNGYFSYNDAVKEFNKPTLIPYNPSNSATIGYKDNVIMHGSLNNNSGKISGFSDVDYMELPKTFLDTTRPWELRLYFKISDITIAGRIIGGHLDDLKQGLVIGFDGTIPSPKLWLSSNNYSWNIAASLVDDTFSILLDTYYHLILSYNGSKYTMSIRPWYDNNDRILVEVNDSRPINQINPFVLGNYGQIYFPGEIDLDKDTCFIKYLDNNECFWKGREEIKESYVYCNALTKQFSLVSTPYSSSVQKYIGKVQYCDGEFILVTPTKDLADSFDNRFIVDELNEDNGYRIYNDGYKEEWGYSSSNSSVMFPISFNEIPSASDNATKISQSSMYVTAGYWFAEGY